MFIVAYVFVVNWLQLHDKLWYLFSGSLYNQWKSLVGAVPLIFAIFTLFQNLVEFSHDESKKSKKSSKNGNASKNRTVSQHEFEVSSRAFLEFLK